MTATAKAATMDNRQAYTSTVVVPIQRGVR